MPTRWLDELTVDARFTVRQLKRSPAFTLVAAVTLALGIGTTTAIFSVVYSVVLRPLPFPDPGRLVAVNEIFSGRTAEASPGNFYDWCTHARSFTALGAMNPATFNLTTDDQPERIVGARATSSWFGLLGIAPLHGRVFSGDEDAPGRNQVVVLSHRLWTRRFGADPAVVGKEIRLSAVPYPVIGVMPPEFDLTADSEELWT
ncbi:MAG: ABC transporter permease, partial [bacterium]